MGTPYTSMADIDVQELSGKLFELIDVDGSGSIDDNEIIATLIAFGAAVNEDEGNEELAGAVGVFFLCMAQLSDSIGPDTTVVTRAQWDAFEPSPFEGTTEEEMAGAMLLFFTFVSGILENKAEIQSGFKEILAAEDFEEAKAQFIASVNS